MVVIDEVENESSLLETTAKNLSHNTGKSSTEISKGKIGNSSDLTRQTES